jgi:TolB-like protein
MSAAVSGALVAGHRNIGQVHASGLESSAGGVRGMAGEIFISYRRADQARAELLHRLLKERGVEAWYDALLGAGEDWRTATAGALEKAPIFVLLFSQAASESTDIAKELAAATLEKKLVVPVRIENIRPKGAFLYELASRNWVDAYDDTEAKFAKLADNLAALVKGGPKAEAAAASLGTTAEAVQAKPKSLWTKRTLVIGAVVAAIVVVAGGAFLLRPGSGAAQAGGYRTAFFGFTPTGDDPAVASAAGIATEETFRLLDLLKVDAISRAETEAAHDGAVLERAGELGARFAVSGDIRREGDLLKSTVRVMDVSSRTTIGQVALQRRADKPSKIAYTTGSVSARMMGCIEGYIASDDAATLNAEAFVLMGRACATDLNDASTSYRELMQKRPKNSLAPAHLADSLMWRLPQLPQAQRPAAIVEAEAAVKRAEEMAPDSYATALARVAFAVVQQEPPLAWLPRLEEVLARAPRPDEALMFARASGTVGRQVMELGRIKDAARYFSQAVINDPTYPNFEYYRSVAQAASGQYGAKDSLDRLVETRVNGYSWEIALAAAIFFNATDPEIVFAAAPADVKDVVPCYRDLIASLKATDRQVRLAGAKRADVCLTAFDSPHVNIQAQSMLGDLDRAFEIFDRPDFTVFMWNYWSPIFLPSTKAMRADPRFLVVAQKLGFVDYWKQTKTQPDVCETAEERDFPVCVALREGG